MSSKFQNDAIFWVEVEKIKPNPYQPRRDFNEERLRDLAESIRQYGILQPLTVTRKEHVKEDGGLKVEYELIAGERRHRASQLANLSQVPVIIRSGEENAQVKLELAIIENLQREDLNPIERAEAFDQLANEFDFTHKEIAKKIGKSREYVSNSMRLLKLPEDIKQAVINGQMTEGHARPIMMLRDKPQEQETLFKEVIHKGLTVREAESIARRDAQDKVRKKKNKITPKTKQLEDRLSDTFGTRVKIEERDVGGKLVIDFFSEEDLENIIKLVQAGGDMEVGDMMEQYVENMNEDEETGESSNSEEIMESESEGKTIAETLGTMIAAARQQHAAETGDNDVTEQVNEESTSHTTVANDAVSEGAESEMVNNNNESASSNTDKRTIDATQNQSDKRIAEQPQEIQSSEDSMSEQQSDYTKEPSVEQETDTSEITTEASANEEDVENREKETHLDEQETSEADEDEEEIYAVSNFSI
ncbi:MAG: ParB/RepB/Spo0J family partition protein [Candidatus Paceibacterota bacterium]